MYIKCTISLRPILCSIRLNALFLLLYSVFFSRRIACYSSPFLQELTRIALPAWYYSFNGLLFPSWFMIHNCLIHEI